MRYAIGLVALVVASQGWAQAGTIRCAETPNWGGYSAVALTVHGTAGDREMVSMTLASAVYDDGARLVVTDGSRRSEIVWVDGPRGRVTLANEPAAPVQLDEIDIVEGLPIEVLMKRFQSPCALQAGVRYPLAGGTAEDSIAGEVDLLGDAIRFDFLEKRGGDRISYAGSVRYEIPRGRIPMDLSIRGWTIFRESMLPDKGVPSTFATLGEFQDSLKVH